MYRRLAWLPTVCVSAICLSIAGPLQAQVAGQVFPDQTWERKTPRELGMDVAKLDELARQVGGYGCVIKDGYLVYAWGDISQEHDWFSASKPVLSTLLLLAVAEGKIAGPDAPVADYWRLSRKDRSMTFRHLANMTSGYCRREKPGQAYAYNDYAISLYVLTLRKVFGQTLEEALQQRLGALQFEDRQIFSDLDSNNGGRIETTVCDYARIGWFWLNKGRWKDRQLLPRELFDEVLKPGVPADLPRSQGKPTRDYLEVGSYGGRTDQTKHGPGIYGFNWWFNGYAPSKTQRCWPDAPPDTFQANGRWGAEVVTVFPSLNMVVASMGEWGRADPGDPDSPMNQHLKLLVEAAGGASASSCPASAPTSQPADPH